MNNNQKKGVFMDMTKKLLLVTIISSGLHLQINASESYQISPHHTYNPKQEKDFLQFTEDNLYQTKNAKARDTAQWMNETYRETDSYHKSITNQLMNIVSDPHKKDEEKLTSIAELRENEENQNKGYFSSMSTFAKAAAALLVTAGIISYLYFIRPWSTSAK